MKSNTLPGILSLLLVIGLAFWWQGCGLDPPKKPPDPIPEPNFPPETPDEVLENVEYAYSQFEFERYAPLIHEGFQFIIWPDDIEEIAPELHQNGVWYTETELMLARNMLDRNFIPQDNAENQIDSMELILERSDPLETSNLEGAPEGTVSARVNLDHQINTVGGTTFDVRSRPIFYFAPDSSVTPVTWSIWRMEDAPYTGG